MLKEIQRSMLIKRLATRGISQVDSISIYDMSIRDLNLTLVKEDYKNGCTKI